MCDRWSPRKSTGFVFLAGLLTWGPIIAIVYFYGEEIIKAVLG